MAIIRNKLKSDFTTIPNKVIDCKDLNDGEFRLLIYLYKLPDNWEVNQMHLANEFELSREQINRRIQKLKTLNYLRIDKVRKGQEKWEYVYTLTIPSVTKTSQHEMSQHEMSQPIKTNYIKKLTNYIKEINKEKIFEDESLDEVYKKYLKMRYEKKCKATETTIEGQQKKLNNRPVSEAINILQYSIDNGYQGLFEEKGKSFQPKKEVEKVPDWFNQEIKEDKLSAEEQRKVDEMLKEFKEEENEKK